MAVTHLHQLQDSVSHLSQTAESQIEYLKELGVYPSADELALEFDDVYGYVRDHAAELGLPTEQREQLQRLDSLLASMSGVRNAHLWHANSLKFAKEWEEVRTLALSLNATFDRNLP